MARTSTASSTEVLAGLVDRVTFHNEENRFCMLRVKARGTVNLFGRGQRDSRDWGRYVAAYIVMATLLISAHIRNDSILAALCSAAVTWSRWRGNKLLI